MYNLIDSILLNSMSYDRPSVYVVSDTQYQDYKRAQAERQLKVLESQLNRYQRAVEETQATIVELQESVGLLPESETKKELAGVK